MLKRIVIILSAMIAGAVLALSVGFIMLLQSRQELKTWHTVHLDEEFTADSPIATFDEYLALEERLFNQLRAEVYDAVAPSDQHSINRYSRGSLSDPSRWPVNWNRTFTLTSPQPAVGVLLLHGLSDSPYSLHSIGEMLAGRGAHVVGLRIPGHGTAPSGLVYAQWEDMAAAVVLAMRHLKEILGDRPIYLVGYSNGGALAVHYVLAALDDPSLVQVDGLVLISPEIGIARAAAFAVWQDRIGRLLGLPKLAWNEVLPEFDPYKYNSFAVNAGDQAHRLTGEIQRLIGQAEKEGRLAKVPPILAFQSVVDATVQARALVDGLLNRLPSGDHELVLFDINRLAGIVPLLDSATRDGIAALIGAPRTTYRSTLISNRDPTSPMVTASVELPGNPEKRVVPLGLAWPDKIYSLSHVALPFAPDDPLYGGSAAGESPGIQLGNTVLRGERGVLQADPAILLRMRWNPFYDYMVQRIQSFIPTGQ